MTNSEAATFINDMDISDVENMNNELTGGFLLAPKGVNGQGISGGDYDALKTHLNEANETDVFNDMNPSLGDIAIAVKDPC